MTDQSVFGSNQNPQETPAQAPQSDNVFADQLAAIKNEDGRPKYNSVEEALKGAAHAQDYISQLKQQLQQLETEKSTLALELEKRASVEEVVQRLTAPQDPEQKETPQNQGLDEQSIEQVIERILGKKSQAQIEQDNFNTVQSTLIDLYGDASKAATEVKAKADALGTTTAELEKLAKLNPGLVLELFKAKPTSQHKPNVGGQQVPSTYQPQEDKLEPPKKSLLAGATSQDQLEYMRKVRENVYKRLGVQGN